MIEFGHFFFVVALVLSCVYIISYFAALVKGMPVLYVAHGFLTMGIVLGIVVGFCALMWAYVMSDFSVKNVYENSHISKPLLYKISGVWGNHEGSFLLWLLMIAIVNFLFFRQRRLIPVSLFQKIMVIHTGLIGLMGGFILFTSNPFDRLIFAPGMPIMGQGLNPLLQDYALSLHPPMLYMGYGIFSIVFAFAVGILWEKRFKARWLEMIRPWIILGWSILGGGVILGSWWSYYELGWGGWWFWDPVENASFIPWILSSSLLHITIMCRKKGYFVHGFLVNSFLIFGLTLIGTFFVRSGILTSVHAFASDPARGIFIFVLSVIVVLGSFLFYILRYSYFQSEKIASFVSKEGGMFSGILFLWIAAGTVFLGTVYPLIIEGLGLGRVTVGAPFFNQTVVPLMGFIGFLTVFGMQWKWGGHMPWYKFSEVFAVCFCLAIVSVALVYLKFLEFSMSLLWGYVGVALGGWIMGMPLLQLVQWKGGGWLSYALGMLGGHFGLGIFIVGVAIAGTWSEDYFFEIRVSETQKVSTFDVTLQEVTSYMAKNYNGLKGHFVLQNEHHLYPERRYYYVEDQTTTEMDLVFTGLSDIQMVLGDYNPEKGYFIARLHYRPGVPFIWLGALIMFLGGIASFYVGYKGRRELLV